MIAGANACEKINRYLKEIPELNNNKNKFTLIDAKKNFIDFFNF